MSNKIKAFAWIIALLYVILVGIPIAILLYMLTTPLVIIINIKKWIKKNGRMTEY